MMKTTNLINLLLLSALSTLCVRGQGTFENLNFESAELSAVPPGGTPVVFVPVTSGLPGWTASVGSTELTQIPENNYTLGEASVDIFGPNYPAAGPLNSPPNPGVIDGNYSVLLQAGGAPAGDGTVGASIAQTGTVPPGSESIEFKAWQTLSTEFTVSLAGSVLTPVVLGTAANYTLYGASIPSTFDGRSAQLEFTADFATPGTSWLGLDDISFSPQAIPEPSPLALTGIGGLLFVFYRRFAPKRQ